MTDIHETLNAIKEAAAALEREPEHLAGIMSLQESLDKSMQHAQNLELTLIGRNDRIAALEAQVRSLEVERDDASFRALELEDRLGHIAEHLDRATSFVVHMATPEQQPESVVQPATEMVSGQSEANPTPVSIATQTEGVPENASMYGIEQNPHPVQATADYDPIPLPRVSEEPVASKPQRYVGKTYSQATRENGGVFISRVDWETQGGTYDNYWI